MSRPSTEESTPMEESVSTANPAPRGESAPTKEGASTTESGRIDVLDESPTALAQDLVVAFGTGTPTAGLLEAIAALSESDLRRVREDRRTALAFWSNCYNAGTQRLLDDHPGLYESSLRFLRFFRAPAITVAGTALPLDRIENGLLRGGRTKYGLGYLPRFLVTRFERRYTLTDCDPRIHFALNCGAESCPAIRAYDPKHLDDQLDHAARTYLDATVEYDAATDVVHVPRVFRWYRGDFGGASGIRGFLREYDQIPVDTAPTIRYLSWDWSMAPDKFAE